MSDINYWSTLITEIDEKIEAVLKDFSNEDSDSDKENLALLRELLKNKRIYSKNYRDAVATELTTKRKHFWNK